MQVLPVNWSVDTLDWTTKNADEIVNKVVTEVKENDIILMHDCYESSVNAALRIVDILKESGYEFVTVEELILHRMIGEEMVNLPEMQANNRRENNYR